MANEWPIRPLGDVCELKRGYDLPQQKREGGDVPIVSSSGVSGTHSKPMVKSPGVVTGRYGTIGQVFFVRQDFWPLNTTLYVRDFKGNDPLFIGYLLRTIDYGSCSDKGAVPGVNRNHLHELHVKIPPLPEQRAIAHILGTLDDKIELNRRTNATLEAMARALFQSWFVDFDPVRAKQQGRSPARLDPATAASFPAEFEDSELGEIPKGWKVGTLGEVTINHRRGIEAIALEKTEAYIGLEHMPRRSVALDDWGTAAKLESNKSSFKRNEILFGKLRPYFHKVGIAPIDGVCSTDILVISPRSEEWFGFALGHCSSDALVKHTDAMSTGTKMPRANWKDIADYGVILPTASVATAFTNAVSPAFGQITANIHQSRTLATLRDALLPKLLSGELSVTAAEHAVADAGEL